MRQCYSKAQRCQHHICRIDRMCAESICRRTQSLVRGSIDRYQLIDLLINSKIHPADIANMAIGTEPPSRSGTRK
jgi:hypothetical protein